MYYEDESSTAPAQPQAESGGEGFVLDNPEVNTSEGDAPITSDSDAPADASTDAPATGTAEPEPVAPAPTPFEVPEGHTAVAVQEDETVAQLAQRLNVPVNYITDHNAHADKATGVIAGDTVALPDDLVSDTTKSAIDAAEA